MILLGLFLILLRGESKESNNEEVTESTNNLMKKDDIKLNEPEEHQIIVADSKINKIKHVKKLLEKRNVDPKRKTKVVLVFNDITQLESLITDMKEYEITIDQAKLESIKKVKRKKERRKREDRRDLDNIPLGHQALCILFKYLNLLSENQKIEDVEVSDLLVTNQNTDVFNKLKFKEADGKLVDATGYFTGRKKVSEKIEDDAKVYETGLFHFKNLDKETERRNSRNFRRILSHIATLKKVSITELFKEECELSTVDRVIFFSNYKFEDLLSVCVCTTDLCDDCTGSYKVSRGSLR